MSILLLGNNPVIRAQAASIQEIVRYRQQPCRHRKMLRLTHYAPPSKCFRHLPGCRLQPPPFCGYCGCLLLSRVWVSVPQRRNTEAAICGTPFEPVRGNPAGTGKCSGLRIMRRRRNVSGTCRAAVCSRPPSADIVAACFCPGFGCRSRSGGIQRQRFTARRIGQTGTKFEGLLVLF